jgi:tRNA A-37 threonylcarbamoyl transferase component Bud32/membrane-associated phospholipid phosphatase
VTAADPVQAASPEAATGAAAGAATAAEPVPARSPGVPPALRTTGRRRRPSGEGPALPRELRRSGRFWIIGLAICAAFLIFVAVHGDHAVGISSLDAAVSRAFASIRVAWLTAIANGLNWLGSDWVNLTLRWLAIIGLIYFRRMRHLVVFVGAVLLIGWMGSVLPMLIGRPRPFDVTTIGDWTGFALPSAAVAALAATLLGIGFGFLPDGRWKIRWFYATDVVIVLLGLARIYLGVDHLTDAIVGACLGMGIMVLAFRFFCPESSFPVAYGSRGRSAHLDLGGARGEAIRHAIHDQLGLTVLDVKPFGLGASGGSTPMRIRVTDPAGAEFEVFGKLYASTHVRADRNYKITRAIMYGRLEDERPFASVRHLVEFEDYMLRVMRDAGVNVAATYGFVEITPELEYLMVTEFLDGAKEISDAEIDVGVIDSGLAIIRQLWDAGLAHRDVKPANILVRDGQAHIIDVAFGEVRPSPWRQAVDLANMMLVLGVYGDPNLVFERALRQFTPDDIAEAFAAVRGVAIPTQLRSEMKAKGGNTLAEFRSMVPQRPPIAIQRWSVRRIGLTIAAVAIILIALALVLGNLQGAGLL